MCLINTVPVSVVLSIDVPTQMEPGFNSEQKRVTKMRSSLVITTFNYLNLCCFIWLRLSHNSVWYISCLRQTQLNAIRKLLMKVEIESQDIYGETYF
jgi:hypothetical protein